MVFWRTLVGRLLESEVGGFWRVRRYSFFIVNHHDYSIHSEWMGPVCWRASSGDRNRCFPHEGSGSSSRIRLSAATGRSEGVTVGQRIFFGNRHAAAAHLIAAFLTTRTFRL